MSVVISNRHQKYLFLCRLLKMADTKNKSLFLVTIGITSRYHKKILGVTINHFSSSACDKEHTLRIRKDQGLAWDCGWLAH
jgi:hypothetical protein